MTDGQTRSWHSTGSRLAAGLLLGATVLALAPAAVATPAEVRPAGRTDGAALQRALDAFVTQAGASGALAEVRENGRVAWNGTSGVRDLVTKAPVPANGRFRAGSVTKTFVAEGRVGLDDSIEHHLPGVVPGGGAITVRRLLNHTSGIFDYTEDPKFEAVTEAQLEQLVATDRWTTYTPQQLIAAAVDHPPYFAPGEGWHYSNTGYLLIGELIGKVTGRSWRTEVQRRILQPIGLHHTYLPGTATSIPGPHSHGYLPLATGPADITELHPSVAGAAGEIISTTEDLTRFDAALLGGRLLRPAQLAEMTTTLPANVYPPTEYGLGLFRLSLPCGDVWGHPGGIHGYLTYVFGDRSGTRQIAISGNLYDPVKAAALTPTALTLIGQTFCQGTPDPTPSPAATAPDNRAAHGAFQAIGLS
ncbi:serine hydrolase domain-containing protein [Kitasatospora sp. NPDC101801]|uniref:serine hydrolase domain-containing protein n=1 Tax=Kitasatospora sp. NPDC101801 TaxID=3364103 RepID=UPI00381A703B